MAEPSTRSPVLTPAYMAQAGRALTLDGEHVSLIEIDPARGLSLIPVASHGIGRPRPAQAGATD